MRDACAHIGLHARRCRLLHVRHVLEVVVALLDTGGPSEVVEREGRVAAFREAERELLVEAIEPADVRAGSRRRRAPALRAPRGRRRTGFRPRLRARGRRARRPLRRSAGSVAPNRGRSTRRDLTMLRASARGRSRRSTTRLRRAPALGREGHARSRPPPPASRRRRPTPPRARATRRASRAAPARRRRILPRPGGNGSVPPFQLRVHAPVRDL